MNSNAMNDELLDLLTERALGELSSADEQRLGKLLEAAGLHDEDDIELAIAAAMNAFARADESSESAMPDGLANRLEADAGRYFDSAEKPSRSNTAAPDGTTLVPTIEQARARRSAMTGSPNRGGWTGRLGWAVAAMLAVAVVVTRGPQPMPAEIDPAAARATLMTEANSTVLEWARPEIPAYNGVTGDVVWNDERQEGYLRLSGMPMNDPTIAQYQLWIVDPDRDANPVDGGVFDVPAGVDEIIIPIDAKLAVNDPAAFAITREQPGGVVVSDGPLLVVAAI
jgi:hypothetical protein